MSRKILGRRGWLLGLAGVLVAVLAVLALTLARHQGQPDTPSAAQSTGATPKPVPEEQHAVAMPKSEPVSLDIPKIDAHSSLIPLGLNPDNSVATPPLNTPMQAGWYTYAPTPGEIGP